MPCRAPADVSPAHMFGVQNTPIRNSPAAAAMSILSPSPPYPVKCCLQRHPDESSEYMLTSVLLTLASRHDGISN